jgi:ATP-dependent Clp protease ATP-binding subunit ClpA
MLNQELELSLNMAFARAREHRHEFMTVEHLLLALLSNPSAREALEACSVDLVALRQELEAFIEQTTPVLPASEEERDTQPTLSFQRVLQRAVFHVQSSGRSEVTGANVWSPSSASRSHRRPICCANTKSADSTWLTLSLTERAKTSLTRHRIPAIRSITMKSKQAGRIVWKTSPPTLTSLLALAVSTR